MTGRQGNVKRAEYLSVSSEWSALGTYMCQLSLGESPLRSFDRDTAQAYVAEVTWAIVCAEHDAAVFAQLSGTKLELPLIAEMMRGLRDNRRPILDSATYPLRLNPIVSQRDKVPRLTVQCEGTAGWQWELDEARQHAQQVAEVSAAVDLDAAYRMQLRSVGLDEGTATGYVTLLRDHIPGTIDTSVPPERA